MLVNGRKFCFVNGKKLPVPKNIVRKNYLFGVSQYLQERIILERMLDEGGY